MATIIVGKFTALTGIPPMSSKSAMWYYREEEMGCEWPEESGRGGREDEGEEGRKGGRKRREGEELTNVQLSNPLTHLAMWFEVG